MKRPPHKKRPKRRSPEFYDQMVWQRSPRTGMLVPPPGRVTRRIIMRTTLVATCVALIAALWLVFRYVDEPPAARDNAKIVPVDCGPVHAGEPREEARQATP